MTTRAEVTNKVVVVMERSDVIVMLAKAEMVPVTFGKFWCAELSAFSDGGLQITFTENVAINPPPRLGKVTQ